MESHSNGRDISRRERANSHCGLLLNGNIGNDTSSHIESEINTEGNQQPREMRTYRLYKSLQLKAHADTTYFEVLKKTLEHTVRELKILNKDSMIRTTLEALWRTIFPNIPRDQNFLTQNSTKVFLIAILEAQSKNNGICEDAIHMLVNFSNEPLVSNIAVTYIETKFKEQLDVLSSAIPSVSEPTQQQENSRPVPLGNASIDITRYHRLNSSSLLKTTCLILISLKKQLLTLVVLLLLVIFLVFFTYIMRHLKKLHPESAQTNTYPMYSASYNVSTTEISLEKINTDDAENVIDMRIDTVRITVISYQELIMLLNNTSEAHISLEIVSHSAGSWPIFSGLTATGKTHYSGFLKIKEIEISGDISIPDVIEILAKADFAHKIVLKNDGNKLCDSSKHIGKLIVRRTVRNVSKLVLQGFSICSRLYEVLSDNIIMPALRGIVMENCVIEESNSLYIQSILLNCRDTLESIEFSRTVLLTPIIDHKLRTFGEVRYLKMDILKAKNARNIVYIPRQIHHIFPFLETFNSTTGHFPIDEFSSLSQCSNLRAVQIGLLVSDNSIQFDLDTLFKDIPSVTKVKLALKFSELEYDCKLVGLRNLKKRMHVLEVRSNCSIEF